MAEEKKVVIKLLVDTKAQKVLFAEARKEFVDFLFQILSLPIGTVVKLLNQQSTVGSFGDLCKSIENLDDDYLQPNVTKDSVLQPLVFGASAVKVLRLLLNDDAPAPSEEVKKIYRCASSSYSSCRNYYSDREGAFCPQCGTKMSSVMTYVAPKDLTQTLSSSGSIASLGFVKGVVTYMVMDNLEVRPMSTISCIALINKFHVKDVGSLEEREVQVGHDEWLTILKASLETRAALTAVFLGIKQEKK